MTKSRSTAIMTGTVSRVLWYGAAPPSLFVRWRRKRETIMIRITDSLAGDRVRFNCATSTEDLYEIRDWYLENDILGFDTEGTGLNTYHPQWKLRTAQFGTARVAYVIPARYRRFIAWCFHPKRMRNKFLIGHNGPHDIRSIDCWLGYDTGAVCGGETYIPGHYHDPRGREDGGIGHGLKDLSVALVDRQAGKWEKQLKEEFKKIEIPIPGEVYKSGAKKGLPKVRKAKISEGWSLINPFNKIYIAYAAADPVLTYRVWHDPRIRRVVLQSQMQYDAERQDLYSFDWEIQQIGDALYRRAMLLDAPYTRKLSAAYQEEADRNIAIAKKYGCNNINSGDQVAATIIKLGAKLREKTDTGKWKTDAKVLRGLLDSDRSSRDLKRFIHAVLLAKQVIKRRSSYTEGMLNELDAAGRIHPSINTLAALTHRMSVSGPPLQQLPTKDRENDVLWTDTDDSEEAAA